MMITGRPVSAAKTLENPMQPPEAALRVMQRGAVETALGKLEPFAGVRNVAKSAASKVDVVAGSGLMFRPD